MQKTWLAIPIFLLAIAMAVVPAAFAGQSNSSQQEQKAKVFQGDLVGVDMQMKTFTIKNADSDEWQFQYTPETKLEGAENVQGLSTKIGTRVSVDYKEQADKKIATRIEILK
jgi:hypothetical protein